MNLAIFDKPFFEITLPIMLTMIASVWAMISTNNKGLEDVNRRIDEVIRRLDRIESMLDAHESRIEERTSPLRR